MGFSGCEQTVGRSGHTDPTSANTVKASSGASCKLSALQAPRGRNGRGAEPPEMAHVPTPVP